MNKLSDFKGEEALDVLADIIEPLANIFADKDIGELAKNAKSVPPIKFITIALKNHKPEIIEILARLEGEPVEEYKDKINFLTLPLQLLALANDDMVKSLFISQSQTAVTSLAFSGSATETIEAEEN